MKNLIARVFLLSIVAAFGVCALIYGCSSSLNRARETAPRAAESSVDITGLAVDQRSQAARIPGSPFSPTGAGSLTTGGYDANDSILTPSQASRAEELWVIEKGQQQVAETPIRNGSPRQTARQTQEQWEKRRQSEFVRGQVSEGRQFRGQTAAAPTTQAGVTALRPPPAPEPNVADLIPGSGTLVAKLADQKLIPIPLKHTDVKASIAGYVATVDVTQQYQNPYAEKIEAIYVFPLPDNAAVNEFVMTIGDRKIRGIIREKEEARRIYDNARAQGYTASLLTEERPNIFTQSIANIEPGKQIDVDIKYFHTLEYADGWYEYHFPMVVGPRFNPPGYSEGVGAKAHGSAMGSSGQPTEIPYLRPDERSGHDISLSLDIDAGVKVEEIKSVNHQIVETHPAENVARVTLASSDSIPNKDFVLRYKVAGKTVKSAVMAQRDEKSGGGYFTLMLFPPESLQDLPRKPLEMVFTLDVSGSMSGKPIEQAKGAVRYSLQHMRPDDTFNVIRFAGSAEQMSSRAVPANERNVAAGLQYIESMQAGGGTMMIEGIRKSLQVTPDAEHLRFVAFLTDGFIGNEPEILAEIHNLLGPTRIFSFGVGPSTNRYLLDHMAKLGQGAAAYLSLNDDAEKVMAGYFERISHPALTDLSIDFGNLKVSEVYPAKLPDLFVGRPVIITGRYAGNADAATVKVKGKVGGESRELALNVNVADSANQHRGIAPVWARAKIADLGDRLTWQPNTDVTGDIKQVALEYGLMSPYTSFVAVDSSQRTQGDHGTSIAVPVPMPEGVRYDTTVSESAQ